MTTTAPKTSNGEMGLRLMLPLRARDWVQLHVQARWPDLRDRVRVTARLLSPEGSRTPGATPEASRRSQTAGLLLRRGPAEPSAGPLPRCLEPWAPYRQSWR